MFRYVIFVWNINNASDVDAVHNMRRRIQGSPVVWRCALDRPGMYVAYVDQETPPDAAILVDDCRGVILGTIFPSPEASYSSPATPIRVLSQSQSEDILRSTGRSLISKFWGYYIAALHFPEQFSSAVLRSPVSPLPCFHVEQNTLNVFFSHVEDCIDLKMTPLSINWDSITAQVSGGDHLSNETGISEISSLECGECVECKRSGRVKHAFWDPRALLEDRDIADFAEAAKAVRRVTDYCISAHSSGRERVLVKLSGGLDSSIVLSSLSRAAHRPTITAVTYYSRGSGDERCFARSMARAANCRLAEHARNQQLDLRRFLACNRTVRPVLQFSAPDVESRNIALARELNAAAMFDGELGDNIFGSYPGIGALVECYRQRGLRREFLDAALDFAILSKQSIWRTLALTLQEARNVAAHPDFIASSEIRRVLGADGARSSVLASMAAERHHDSFADRFLHPWLRQSRRIAPGSHGLLFGLITVTSTTYHSPFAAPHDPIRVSPLVSQPLVELALRTRPYLHCKYAQDRAVARTAFGDVLPPEILQRGLGKGGPGLWIRDVIENNTGFLREFLLDGVLAERRLIDRAKLETVLSPRIAKSTVVACDIFAKLYIEAWLRAWQKAESPTAGQRVRAG